MPYIITTTTPGDGMERSPNRFGRTTRRAEPTLDKARAEAADLATFHGRGDSYSIDEAYAQIARLPESGGTVGPLPDGTTITVERVTEADLRSALPDDSWGAQAADLANVIDAFNAAQ